MGWAVRRRASADARRVTYCILKARKPRFARLEPPQLPPSGEPAALEPPAVKAGAAAGPSQPRAPALSGGNGGGNGGAAAGTLEAAGI